MTDNFSSTNYPFQEKTHQNEQFIMNTEYPTFRFVTGFLKIVFICFFLIFAFAKLKTFLKFKSNEMK